MGVKIVNVIRLIFTTHHKYTNRLLRSGIFKRNHPRCSCSGVEGGSRGGRANSRFGLTVTTHQDSRKFGQEFNLI